MASVNHGLLVLFSVLLFVTPAALATSVDAISATCNLSSTSTSTTTLDPITTTTYTESLYSCSSTAAPATKISDAPAAKSSAVADQDRLLQEEPTVAAAATNCTTKVTISPIYSLDSITSQVASNCSEALTPQSAPYLLSSSDCDATSNFSAGSIAISTACNVSATSENVTKSSSSKGTSRCTTTPASSTTDATMTTTSISSSCSYFESLSPPPRRIAIWSNCTSLAFTPTAHHTSTTTTSSCSSLTILWNGFTITSRSISSINCTTTSSTSSALGTSLHSETSCSMDNTILTSDTPTRHRPLFPTVLKNPLLSIISSIDDHHDF